MERWKDKKNMVMVNFYLPQEVFDQLLSISQMIGYPRSQILRTATINELDRLAAMYNERAEKRRKVVANIDRCLENATPTVSFNDDDEDDEWDW